MTTSSVSPVSKPKMVMRSQYVPLKLWEKAKAVADANEQNISDAVREGLELYIEKRGSEGEVYGSVREAALEVLEGEGKR